MVENEKEHGFIDTIKDGLSSITRVITAGIFSQITGGAEIVMKNIEDSLLRTGKKILKEMYSLAIIGLGGILLLLALFFFLTEYVGWSNALAFFSLGIIVFVIGLLLKAGKSDR